MGQLTDTYVAAATRALPPGRRAGVAEGLHRSIAAKTHALRAADATLDADQAEYAALVAHGDPAERLPRSGGRHLVVRPRTFGIVLAVAVALTAATVTVSHLLSGPQTARDWDALTWMVMRTCFRTIGIVAIAWFLVEVGGQSRRRRSTGKPHWAPEDLAEPR
ncbi:hypothetical protein [Nocardioides sp. AE5]|uniref:hypothetical protein n=1 Tax=Nocardioides sp. AE5 TaxID=2962573 RepID=UPI0028829EB5|nr:hypothetical protein [Nocardioides sp. AE5]MDT0201949.1 hypothetical protein [Nocardioides sp. AE5]